MAANVDCFIKDREESENFVFEELIQLFTEKQMRLRNIINLIAEDKISNDKTNMPKYTKEAGFLIMDLRRLQRLGQHLLSISTEKMNEKRTELDLSKCNFIDLLREKAYINKEIEKCLGFRSVDKELSLLSVEEFMQNAPLEWTENPHELQLNRLNWELKERRQLLTKLAKSEAKKERIHNEIKKLVDYCNSLLTHVSKLNEVMEPFQSKLGLPQSSLFSKYEAESLLPKPLCYIFRQALVFVETNDMPINVSISGNIEEAKAFDLLKNTVEIGPVVKFKIIDKDDEEKNVTCTRQNLVWNALGPNTDLHIKHPLAVDMYITENDAVLYIKFHYLIHLKLLTVIVQNFKMGNANEHINFDLPSFLCCLFPDDDGKTSLSLKNKLLMKRAKNEGKIIFSHDTTGLPYAWVQKLGGSEYRYYNEQVVESLEEHITFIEEVFLALKSRIRGKVGLHTQICFLEKGSLMVCKFRPDCPQTTITEIKDWSLMPYYLISDHHPSYNSLMQTNVINANVTVYKAYVELGAATLHFHVIISPTYPVTAPFFLLYLNWKTHNLFYTSASHFNIKELEEEINLNCVKKLPQEHRDFILTWQLHHLLAAFEIFLATEDALLYSGQEFSSNNTFPKAYRGRGHSRPYEYIPSLHVFT